MCFKYNIETRGAERGCFRGVKVKVAGGTYGTEPGARGISLTVTSVPVHAYKPLWTEK